MTHTTEFNNWLLRNDPDLERLGAPPLAGEDDLKMFARESKAAHERLTIMEVHPNPPAVPTGPDDPLHPVWRFLIGVYAVGAILLGAAIAFLGLLLVAPVLFLWDWLKGSRSRG